MQKSWNKIHHSQIPFEKWAEHWCERKSLIVALDDQNIYVGYDTGEDAVTDGMQTVVSIGNSAIPGREQRYELEWHAFGLEEFSAAIEARAKELGQQKP